MYSSIRNSWSFSSPSISILDESADAGKGASKSAKIELASCNVKTADVVRWKFRERESSFEAVDSQVPITEEVETAAVEIMFMLDESAEVEEIPVDEEPNWLSILSFSQLTAHCHFSESSINFSFTLEDLLAAATNVLIH